MEDDELRAMTQVSAALGGLDEVAIARVLRYFADRNGTPLSSPISSPRVEDDRSEGAGGQAREEAVEFKDFADFYNRAAPSTDAKKCLVAGYWIQVNGGNQDFMGFEANKILKNLGHGVSNVTAALSTSIQTKPQLIIQTRKDGSSKQARKKYRVTGEGINSVRAMTVQESA